MAKKDWKNQDKQKWNGFVYIIKIEIGAETIFKLGTTNRTPIRRMLEIAEEMNRALGYIPKMMLIRGKQMVNNYLVEKELLEATKDFFYYINDTISGYTEFRKMEEYKLLIEYEKAINKNYAAPTPYLIEL